MRTSIAGPLLIASLLAASCTTPAKNSTPASHMNQTGHTVTLLGFPGCPNTPELAGRLEEALRIARLDLPVEHIDLTTLPDSDPRRGYGAPTVLVGGRDLLGHPPAASTALTCRVYPGGLPDTHALAAALSKATNR